jgi:hypothetical protein
MHSIALLYPPKRKFTFQDIAYRERADSPAKSELRIFVTHSSVRLEHIKGLIRNILTGE